MEENLKTRYRFIDYFKTIAIVFVILGHASFANRGIVGWIYAFHMPAFFFASGMVLKNDTETNLKSCVASIWKKIQSVMFPFFVWALIYTSLEPKNVIKIIYGSHYALKSAGTLTSLWFLPVLFISTTFFEISKLVFKKGFKVLVKVVLMICTFVIAVILPDIERGYPWNLNVSFCAFGFLLLGNIMMPAIQIVREKLNELGKPKSLFVCVGLICLFFAGSLLYKTNIPPHSIAVSMARAFYGSFPLFFLNAVIGILFVLFTGFLLDFALPKQKEKCISFVGRNTFSIFVVHKPIVRLLFGKVFSLVTVPAMVALTVTTIGTLIISGLMTLFINYYLPLLSGHIPSKEK